MNSRAVCFHANRVCCRKSPSKTHTDFPHTSNRPQIKLSLSMESPHFHYRILHLFRIELYTKDSWSSSIFLYVSSPVASLVSRTVGRSVGGLWLVRMGFGFGLKIIILNVRVRDSLWSSRLSVSNNARALMLVLRVFFQNYFFSNSNTK